MILVGLGSNLPSSLGPPAATVRAAIDHLEETGITVLARSSIWESAPVPASDQPWFANAAVSVESDLGPDALLNHLHAIEAGFARRRKVRWGPRTLDLDLLAYGDVIRPDPERWAAETANATPAPGRLVLPHPRLHLRRFVLEPLAEIAPAWRHPVLEKHVEELRVGVVDTQEIRRLGSADA